MRKPDAGHLKCKISKLKIWRVLHAVVDIQRMAGHWSAVLTKSDPSAGGDARANHPQHSQERRGSKLARARSSDSFPILTAALKAKRKSVMIPAAGVPPAIPQLSRTGELPGARQGLICSEILFYSVLFYYNVDYNVDCYCNCCCCCFCCHCTIG